MINTLVKTSSSLLLAMVMLTGCSKPEKPDLDNSTIFDNANSQSIIDDALKITEDVLARNNKAKTEAGHPAHSISCAPIDSIKAGADLIIFLITFDNTCTGYDGKVRSGQLKVTLRGSNFNTPGSMLTIKSIGYRVNGISLEGMKTVTCMVGGNLPVHEIIVSDTTTGDGYAAITYPDGKMAKWKSYRTRTMVGGGETATVADNIYEISTTPGIGNPVAHGINREGRPFAVNIQSPLRVNFNCLTNNTGRYPTQGILELLPDAKKARVIDYGDGQCDNEARITIDGKSYGVRLLY